ncbi:GntR family transcriptional regulator [Gordonia terrae]
MATIEKLAVPPTRAGAVAQRLREMIQSGEILPGTQLRQTDIATRFGVSTTPVREAFAILIRDGLARQDAHRSVSVFQPSADELAEIYEIRLALEPLLSEKAATAATLEQLTELEKTIVEMRAVEHGSSYLALNATFHSNIYEMAHRPRLAEIVDGLRKTSANYLNLTVRHPDDNYRRQVHAEHEELFAALKARKAKLAAKITRQHLETTSRHVLSLVSESNASTQ